MHTLFPAFLEMVHDALNHLYDSKHLQQHPLGAHLIDAQSDPVRRSQQLRKVLLDAISAMRPQAGVPAQSPDWRAYRLLELRYIEGQDVREVMEQIALAKSQYYREQTRVVEALATNLWAQPLIQESLSGGALTNVLQSDGGMNFDEGLTAESDSEAGEHSVNRQDVAHAEVQLLLAQAVWETVDLVEVLKDLQAYVVPLATAKQIEVIINAQAACTVEPADRALVRQAILTTITYGMDRTLHLQQGKLHQRNLDRQTQRLVVRSFHGMQEQGIAVRLQCGLASAKVGKQVPPKSSKTPVRSGVGLTVCRQLMENMGGQLKVQSNDDASGSSQKNAIWEAFLTWPIPQDASLLVIDDNASFADLFRRYLHQHRWRVIGATSGREARQLLQEMHPSIILLDVMLPKEDGWEILRDLRSQSALDQTPIVICSVLNEPELASMLGASAFLLKPVTQQALLAVLAPWLQDAAIPVSVH